MAEHITGFKTAEGVKKYDYNSLANKPVLGISGTSAGDLVNMLDQGYITFNLAIGGAALKDNVITFTPESNGRCVTPRANVFDRNIVININSGYRVAIWYCDADLNYETSTGWRTGTVNIAANRYFILQVSLASGDSPTPLTEEDRAAHNSAVYTTANWRYLVNKLGSSRIANVKLLASAWTGSASPYAQVVTISGITANSQVDLTPSVEQLAIFHQKDLAFVTENEGGVVTVYAIGDKPTNDYTIQATITEVIV